MMSYAPNDDQQAPTAFVTALHNGYDFMYKILVVKREQTHTKQARQ